MDVPKDQTVLIKELLKILKDQNISTQAPATKLENRQQLPFIKHPTTGSSRLIDGTIIQIAGTDNVKGDPIYSTIKVKGYDVFFDAIGVAAVRLNRAGKVEAIVGGGLKSFKTGSFEINLENRIDIALWKNDRGKWEGIIQGWKGKIPLELLAITRNWNRLGVPVPFPEQKNKL